MEEFLKPFKKLKREESSTHTSMVGGKWDIPTEMESKFLKLYAKEIDADTDLYMTEKHLPDHGPIVIDLDFEFAERDNERQVNRSVRKAIAKHLISIVWEIFGGVHKYTCVVLQRPTRYPKGEKWSDGLHIQFPFINCKYDIQFEIRKQFMETFKMPFECANSYDDIYDKSVIKDTNWCLYGSTKKGKRPYAMREIYGDMIEWEKMTTFEKVTLLSIRKGGDPIKPIDKLYLEIHDGSRTNASKKQNTTTQKSGKKSEPAEIEHNREYDEEQITTLLGMLKQERCDNYKEWRNVGLILHNCSITNVNDDIDFLNIWDKWSKQSKKYERGACKKAWDKFTNTTNAKSLTLSSLYYYAQQDNPDSWKILKLHSYIMNQEKLTNGVCTNNDIMITSDEYDNETREYILTQKDQTQIKDFKIKSLIKKQHGVIAELDTQKFCPFIKGIHEKNCVFMTLNRHGWCLRCTNCPYEQYPERDMVQLPNRILQTLGVDSIPISNSLTDYTPEYDIFDDSALNNLVYQSLSGTATKISNLIYHVYSGRFNCVGEDVEWYEFKGHRWTNGSSLVLFNAISADLPTYYIKLIEFYESMRPTDTKKGNGDSTATSKEHRDICSHIDNIVSTAKKVIKQLENMTSKNSIMQNIAATFYINNRDFEKKLDMNKYLIGFENGVYDLKEHQFRDGLPNDHVSMSVGYDYIPKHTKYHNDLLEFLNSIQPHDDDRDFLLKHTATGLCGVNREEICVILSGKGRNGKTKYKDLVSDTLGDYFVTFDSNILTYPRPAPSAPQADLISFNKKRFALGSEPEQKDGAIKTSFFKFITGGEKIPCRGLYDKKITEFEPTHKIGLLCNKIPNMDENDDEAVWDRTRCIEFPTKFVDDPIHPDQRKINRGLKELLPLWRQDFMLLLIEKYKEYQKTGLVVTQKIMQFTKSYKDDNDIYLQFLENCTTKAKTHIHTSVLYECFNTWFRKNSPGQKVPSNKTFCAGLRNHIEIETVRVGNKTTRGVKFTAICDETDNGPDTNDDLSDNSTSET